MDIEGVYFEQEIWEIANHTDKVQDSQFHFI